MMAHCSVRLTACSLIAVSVTSNAVFLARAESSRALDNGEELGIRKTRNDGERQAVSTADREDSMSNQGKAFMM